MNREGIYGLCGGDAGGYPWVWNSATVSITGMKFADRPEPVVLVEHPQSASFGPYDVDSKMRIELKQIR